MQTGKFSQEDAGVYHDYGLDEPCRLLPPFLKKGGGYLHLLVLSFLLKVVNTNQ